MSPLGLSPLVPRFVCGLTDSNTRGCRSLFKVNVGRRSGGESADVEVILVNIIFGLFYFISSSSFLNFVTTRDIPTPMSCLHALGYPLAIDLLSIFDTFSLNYMFSIQYVPMQATY